VRQNNSVANVQQDNKLNDPKKSANAATSTKDDEGIRVSLARVQKLIDFVGEIVILQSALRDFAADTKDQGLKRVVDQVGKVTKDVQDISMSLRMVPAKPIFQKLQRIVRDTSQALKKDINFITSGSETEMDKNLLERIGDPLVHLIRNACDHGIESQEDRIARGKSPTGEVVLNAYRQSGKLVFEIRDDGGGLDPEKLIRIAKSKGVISQDAQLNDKDAMHLIFAPGFSTAAKVTDISGRGVGMDVVRTNLEEMQGTISIESKIGVGTTFKILLPLTLAIIDGMVVSVMNEKFVIPLSQVHETVRLSSASIQSTQGFGDILLLRSENAQLYDLGNLLHRREHGNFNKNAIAIIFRTLEQPYAVVVDDILGRHQVVTKQLGEEVRTLRGLSGCTILGDGKPSLILELDDLVREATKDLAPQNFGNRDLKADDSTHQQKLAS
jgi:two-component system chemotaxis sensor kinase CheA